jgi:phage terminase small subunit
MTSIVPVETDLTSIDIRRQRFIALMLIYGHEVGGPSRAYREAGYKDGPNVDQLATRLLKSAEVQTALQAAQSVHADKLSVQADRVLQELALIAFSDIQHYRMNESGEMEVDEMFSPAVSRAVQAVEYTRTVTKGKDETETVTTKMRIKLWDKNTALTNLMKYLGMLVDRSVNVNLNGKIPLDVARDAIAKAREANALPFQFDSRRLPSFAESEEMVSEANVREVSRSGNVDDIHDEVDSSVEEGPKQPPPLPDDWMDEGRNGPIANIQPFDKP